MSDVPPIRLLFLCTGNICRSPMAEYLARDYARIRGQHVEVASASVMGLEGNPAHNSAVAVMREIHLDLTPHRAQPMTPEILEWADYVLVMEITHAAQAREMLPQAEDRILLLGTFGGMMEIRDPLGGWKRRFRTTRDEIKRCVEAFMDQLEPRAAPESPD